MRSQLLVALAMSAAACTPAPPPASQPVQAPPPSAAPAPPKAAPAPPPAAASPPAAKPADKSPVADKATTAPKPAPGKATVSPPAPAKPAPPPVAKAPAPPTPPAAAPGMDLKGLEQRLKDTDAIGLMTKLSLKNQVDDLVGRFRAYHGGRRPPTLDELRPSFDLLLMKVLSLLQDKDPPLAKDIDRSRGALWTVLADPSRFSRLD